MAALSNSMLFIQKYGAESNDALRLDRYESVRSFQESDRVPILLYFRSVPRLKPLGSAITSVFVSTFAMLSVLWTIFNFIAGALAGSQSDKFSFKLSRWAVNFADIEEQGGPQDRHCCHSAIKVALEVEDREPLTPSKLQANQMVKGLESKVEGVEPQHPYVTEVAATVFGETTMLSELPTPAEWLCYVAVPVKF
ncbi:hypothetical protein DFH09DRAFT_1112583 [Mycena vulgaris]|nr:hypothetical protein DFH09DRAFT_1112583 [Mycena vulgaris]